MKDVPWISSLLKFPWGRSDGQTANLGCNLVQKSATFARVCRVRIRDGFSETCGSFAVEAWWEEAENTLSSFQLHDFMGRIDFESIAEQAIDQAEERYEAELESRNYY